MIYTKQNLEERLDEATKGLIDLIIKTIEEQIIENGKLIEKTTEKVMNAKEVCDYYGFSLATLRRHEQQGLKRINVSLKNKNRMFKLTECEKYFNKKE